MKKFERFPWAENPSTQVPKMSCIFNIFKSKKKTPQRRQSFTVKMTDPIPKTYEEVVEYETFLRVHMNRLNRRYETVSKNLVHARSQQNVQAILACMKERQRIEIQFEDMKKRLKEVLVKRAEFENPPTSKTQTLRLEIVPNPLASK